MAGLSRFQLHINDLDASFVPFRSEPYANQQDLKAAEEELSAARQESSNLQRMVEVLNKKLRQSDERRLDVR